MSNKKVNLFAGIVLPLVVMAATATLFFMFRPKETTALFYINLGYTILLEVILFGYINVLYCKTDDFSTPFMSILGVFSLYYVIAGFGWMLLFSLVLLHFVLLKIYIAGLMVLTLLWIILSLVTGRTDSNYKQTTDKLKADGQTLNYYTQKIALLALRYEKLCAEKGVKYATDSNNRTVLERLKGKISFLTPNVLASETAVSQLSSLFGKCEDIIDETESADDEKLLAELQKKMQRFVDNAISELDMLKNLTRK
jgi:hypothetical protein